MWSHRSIPVALALLLTSPALAQTPPAASPPAQPAAGGAGGSPPAAAPATPETPAPAAAGGASTPAGAPATGMAQAGGSTAAGAAASLRPVAAAQPPSPTRPTGKRKKATKAAPLVAGGPIATYPGFRMIPGGGSRVFVQVSRKVEVTESRAAGRLTYRMKGTQAIQTNQYPLVTGFFPTPVGRVLLQQQGSDLDLVIELRVPSEGQHRVMDTDQGIVVQVDFPAVAPGALPAPPPTPRPPSASRSKKGAQVEVEDESY